MVFAKPARINFPDDAINSNSAIVHVLGLDCDLMNSQIAVVRSEASVITSVLSSPINGLVAFVDAEESCVDDAAV